MTANKHKTTKLLAMGALALPLALGLAGCSADESAHSPREDVDLGWTCVGEAGVVRAAGSVTNHSSKTSFYLVTVTFSANGKRLGSATASADDVASGATAHLSASEQVSTSGDVSCVVSEVERFKA